VQKLVVYVCAVYCGYIRTKYKRSIRPVIVFCPIAIRFNWTVKKFEISIFTRHVVELFFNIQI